MGQSNSKRPTNQVQKDLLAARNLVSKRHTSSDSYTRYVRAANKASRQSNKNISPKALAKLAAEARALEPIL